MKSTSEGESLSKSSLLCELWAYRSSFLRRIRRRIFSREIAEDIFQEACLKLMTSPAVFRYPQAGTKYFCRILHSLIIDHIKVAARVEYRNRLPEICCDPQAEWERRTLFRRTADAIRCLATKDQRLLAD